MRPQVTHLLKRNRREVKFYAVGLHNSLHGWLGTCLIIAFAPLFSKLDTGYFILTGLTNSSPWVQSMPGKICRTIPWIFLSYHWFTGLNLVLSALIEWVLLSSKILTSMASRKRLDKLEYDKISILIDHANRLISHIFTSSIFLISAVNIGTVNMMIKHSDKVPAVLFPAYLATSAMISYITAVFLIFAANVFKNSREYIRSWNASLRPGKNFGYRKKVMKSMRTVGFKMAMMGVVKKTFVLETYSEWLDKIIDTLLMFD
ncbi:hypothetical protein Fcan01_23048 [Folsomia candida]|uniref:Uncharacterized protein n=1 Tax=Folsomia candida TaxID=158441 RepID=A0A226DB63_FOLCA|nr:hypothetical protein Fcan01_23048 [Folsomia candida]